jgi:Carbohydrate binding domain (family 11)
MDVRNIVSVTVLSVGLGLGAIVGLGGCASGPDEAMGDDDDQGNVDQGTCAPEDGPVAGDDAKTIDDLEDGDEGIAENGMRVGSWYSFNDGTAGGTQEPSDKADFKPAMGGCGMFAAKTSGKGFKTWGAGIGLDLNAPPPAMGAPDIKLKYDASAYTGIAFEARGNVSVRFQLAEIATIPNTEGGTCAPSTVEGKECEDGHGKVIPLAAKWKTYKVPFAELAQEGWGLKADFDAKTITGLQWSVKENLEFDFSVDNVRFY